MTPSALLLLLTAAHAAPIFYGTELPQPFLPVLPLSEEAAIDIPDDLRDAIGQAALPPAGWLAASSSLLLRGSRGGLVHELGLGNFREGDGSLSRQLSGGASKDGRFAWHWQKVAIRDVAAVEAPPRSFSTLVYLGSHGQILRRLDGADAPEGLSPAALSANGEVLMAVRRQAGTWTVTAYSFTGKELASVTKAHRLTQYSVSEDGRRALVAWAGLDLPMMVTLIDLEKGERRDIPARLLPAGPWTLGEGWTLRARGVTVTRLP